MRHVLITGGAGFIGSHLVETIRRESPDTQISILDNFSTGRHNLALLDEMDISIIEGDIRDMESQTPLLEDIDVLIHLAAMNRAQRSIEDPVTAHDINVNATLKILELSRKYDFRVVFASSSSVFGNLEIQPRPEALYPTLPTHPYGFSKLAGERYCHIYRNIYRADVRIIRFFSAFGPRQSPKLKYSAVIPKFIQKFINREPVTIYGGEQRRNFTFVKDTAYATYLVASAEEAPSPIYQIGGKEEINIFQLYELLKEIFGYDVGYEVQDYQLGDIMRSAPEMNNLEKDFGFSHQGSLKEALAETVQWMIENPMYFSDN